MRIRAKTTYIFLLALATGLIFFLIYLSVQAASDHPPTISVSGATALPDAGWEYAWGDPAGFPVDPVLVAKEVGASFRLPVNRPEQEWAQADSLLNPEGRSGETILWLRTILPSGEWREPSMLLQVSRLFEVYTGNGTRLYSFGSIKSGEGSDYIGTPARLVTFPRRMLGGPVYIRIYSDGPGIGITNQPQMAGKSELILAMFRDQSYRLVLGACFILIGLLSLYPFWTLGQRAFLMYGCLAASFGVYTIVRTTIMAFYWDHPVLWMFVELLSLIGTVVCIIAFYEQLFGAGYRKVIRLLWKLHLIYAAVLLPITAMGLMTAPFFLTVYQILILVSSIVILAHLIHRGRRGDPDARSILFGFLPLAVGGSVEILAHMLMPASDFPPLSAWGMLVFLLTFILVLVRRSLRMTARLSNSERLSAAGQLAAGIAHEIRNPITVISGYLQLMKKDTENGRMIEVMKGEIDRIQDIINEFLLLAKPVQPRFVLHPLECLLNDVLLLFQTQTADRRITVQLHCRSEWPLIHCDANQIKQVLINVVKNAIEAMPDGGSLRIEADILGEWVTVVCTDTGSGITGKDLKRIGEPFYTTKQNGTGLGVMICRGIVEAHRGVWELASRPGTGTTVTIKLPLQQETTDA